MQALEAGLDKSMVSYLLRHQDTRMIDHYADFRTRPLNGALDKVQGFDGFASYLTMNTSKNELIYSQMLSVFMLKCGGEGGIRTHVPRC